MALDYAKERRQFGRPIASFGMIQRKLADMATRIYVADSMSYRTAGLMDDAAAAIDQSEPDAGRRLVEKAIEEYTVEASILKVFGTEALDFVADEALQILGGYGFTADYPVERHYRDARINRIFEGTNEINRLIIPATVVKRISQGRIPYMEFRQQVDRELTDAAARPAPAPGPLGCEAAATERAKRVVAYTARVLLVPLLRASRREGEDYAGKTTRVVLRAYGGVVPSCTNKHGSVPDGSPVDLFQRCVIMPAPHFNLPQKQVEVALVGG